MTQRLHTRTNALTGVRDGVVEDLQTRTLGRKLRQPCPRGMLQRCDVPLGVRHQAENQARRIAHAGDIIDAAVRIERKLTLRAAAVGFHVNQRDLIVVPKPAPDRFIGRYEFSFTVRDGRSTLPGRPSRCIWCCAADTNPAIDKSAAIIVRQRAGLPGISGDTSGQEIGLHQNLKTVANADDRFTRRDEIVKRIVQVMRNLIGEIRPAAMSSP